MTSSSVESQTPESSATETPPPVDSQFPVVSSFALLTSAAGYIVSQYHSLNPTNMSFDIRPS